MSNIVAVTFDNQEEAGKLRQKLKELQQEKFIEIEDAAVIVRDAEGEVHVADETSHGVKPGAVIGGVTGLLVFAMVPVAGAAAGAAAGGLVGKQVGKHLSKRIDRQFVEDVTAALQPGTSALVLIVNSVDADIVPGVLAPYKGTLYQTSLDPEVEATLRDLLSSRVQ